TLLRPPLPDASRPPVSRRHAAASADRRAPGGSLPSRGTRRLQRVATHYPSEVNLMVLKLSKNRDEVCYPFIQDASVLCDFEVVTDELCGHIGEIIDRMPYDDLRADLEQLQPLAFHANGSIRGRLAVEETDLAWLQSRLSHYQAERSEERRVGHVTSYM